MGERKQLRLQNVVQGGGTGDDDGGEGEGGEEGEGEEEEEEEGEEEEEEEEEEREEDEEEEDAKQHPTRRFLVLCACTIVGFVMNVMVSVVAPFFPQVPGGGREGGRGGGRERERRGQELTIS